MAKVPATRRDRCKAFLQMQHVNAITRTGNPVDDIMAFVEAEVGRFAGGEKLEQTNALVLYFGSDKERDEFVQLWQSAHPGARAKRIP